MPCPLARLVAAGMLLAACKTTPPPADEPAASYAVRGTIEGLPQTTGDSVYIHHEAIPTFVDKQGVVVGMPAMTMPFGVADTVELGGFTVGQNVEFRFDVYWDRSPPTVIRALTPAP